MSVDTLHEQYKKYISIWEKCHHVCMGEDEIKSHGQKYLPTLSDQPMKEYNKYKDRAMFYSASERTLAGLLGSIFRKPPTYTSMGKNMGSVGVYGESPYLLSVKVVANVLSVGRYGLLIDSDREGKGTPYIATYPAQSIINWHEYYDGEKIVLDLVVLKEQNSKPKDRFTYESSEQYRVLYLDKGIVKGEVHTKLENNKWEIEPYTPLAAGKELDEIPFVFMNGRDNSTEILNPIILPVVNVNLSHYRSSADLENGRHLCGLPTPYLAGFKIEGNELRLGSETGYVSNDPQANGGFIEFMGSGLVYLENALKEKENLMSVLGARLLEPQKKGTEAYGTVKLRHTGENSALSQVTMSCSSGMTKALQMLAQWRNIPNKPIIELNQDFVSDRMEPQEIKELVYSWQSGAISWPTLFHNLKQGEIMPNERTEEEEKQFIKSMPPSMEEV